ncbi:hypothetical protein [Noviherbaspirillum pedocola]|uniref:Uncharacterized protein n=1 Tax=Noviherbaspirillum pedocola TaxID=2801341 RepID=A0A934W7T6_9BURK|nr:hypothetical protein [Noviherbaspirillum pedocola]MBK4737817.1 hypothetical protein [Noviherbaspirillum pedocola]
MASRRTNRLAPLAIALTTVAALASPAHAADSKTIVRTALQEGVFVGQMSDGIAGKIQTITRSSSPVQAKVVLVKRFKDVGCGRLKFTLGQEAVPTIGGGNQPFETTFEMNVCADGSYPSDGVNIAQFPVPPQPSSKDFK